LLVFDIPTIAALAVVGSAVFSACSFGVWRHLPEERCLRDWGIALALLCLGAIELYLRKPAIAVWTIPIGNGLFAAGESWKLVALRRLMRRPQRRFETWLPVAAFVIAALPCWWYVAIQPSLTARLIWVSFIMGCWYAGYGWTLAQHRDHQLAGWLRLTIGLQIAGFLLYFARAWVSPAATISPDYTKTTSMLIAMPGFYGLLFNIWMSLTMVLVISSRMHDRIVETLGFNREILVNSPLATAVYRDDGHCVLVNDAYVQLVETPRAELLDQNFRHLGRWRDAGLLDACEQALEAHQSARCEFHTTTPSGRAIWLDCRIHPSSILGTTHLLLQFNDLTERKRLEDQLRQMAFHDPLTMLPNRRLLMDRIQQAQRTSERQESYAALLFIDLDKFKQLNDRHGHSAGDRLLVALSESLSQTVRKSDTVARLGGDEFVVMLEDLGPDRQQALDHAQDMAMVVHQAANRCFSLGDVDYFASASIGIRLFIGTHESPETLLQDADSAMYQSKLNLSLPRFY